MRLVRVVYGKTSTDVFGRRLCPWRRKLDCDHAHCRAYAGRRGDVGNRVREEIHIGKAGDPTAQHLGNRKPRAVGDESWASQAHLGRPYPLVEPALKRHVICEAAQQCHRGVRVGVDQARKQHVLGTLMQGIRRVFLIGARPWQ